MTNAMRAPAHNPHLDGHLDGRLASRDGFTTTYRLEALASGGECWGYRAHALEPARLPASERAVLLSVSRENGSLCDHRWRGWAVRS